MASKNATMDNPSAAHMSESCWHILSVIDGPAACQRRCRYRPLAGRRSPPLRSIVSHCTIHLSSRRRHHSLRVKLALLRQPVAQQNHCGIAPPSAVNRVHCDFSRLVPSRLPAATSSHRPRATLAVSACRSLRWRSGEFSALTARARRCCRPAGDNSVRSLSDSLLLRLLFCPRVPRSVLRA